MSLLRSAGVTVVDCTIDQADTRNEYLAAAVALANRQELDWFISIHFNASGEHKGHGTEVFTYEGRQYQDALDVCANLSELGFTNRGMKAGTGLYVTRESIILWYFRLYRRRQRTIILQGKSSMPL